MIPYTYAKNGYRMVKRKKIEELRRKLPQLKRRVAESQISSLVGGWIRAIEPKLHVLRFSSSYRYDDLKERLGRLKKDVDYISEEKRYKDRYIRNFKHFSLYCLINPTEKYLPNSYIEFHPKTSRPSDYKKVVNELKEKLPDLTISKIEYAIDLICYPQDSSCNPVQYVFDMLRYYIYFPYKRNAKTLPDDTFSLSNEPINISRSFKLETEEPEDDEVKIYERGTDESKNESGGWDIEDADRVRIEYTCCRKNLKNKLGLDTIEDLLECSMFSEAVENLFRFVEFKHGTHLPKLGDPYTVEDESGYAGTFHYEFKHAKEQGVVKNIAQNVFDVPHFEPLMDTIASKTDEFDSEWVVSH
ncbi:MAG: hypothetical protein KQI78_14510 [Deltaproteobacteria bacterium]|nr:hypothetical protein [Deltaproteobacteria bacterium]